MPTEKHRIAVTVEDWLWDAVEDYRYQRKLTSKSQAAVELIEKGLEAAKKEEPANQQE